MEITNPTDMPDSVTVSNLDDVVKQLQTSVGEVIAILSKPQAKPEELKPSLVKGLADVKKAVTSIKIPEAKDLSNKFDEVVSAIEKVEFKQDNSDVVASLQALQGVIDALEGMREFTRFDEVKVHLNEKQVEALTKAM